MMASSVSSNGGSNNVMMRSKADSLGAAGGGGHTHATSIDERSVNPGVGTTLMGTAATGVAAAPERGAATTADDSAISFSEEEEDEVDEDDDDEEEDDSGSVMAEPESAAAAAAAAAFNAAAAAAFQRQLLANFPLFHADGPNKMDMNDPSNASAMEASANNGNPFETYIAAAAAAAAAAANAEALFRHQQQLTAMSAGSRSEKRSAAHDSGTDDNDVSISGKGAGSGSASVGIQQQQSNKRRKQSKPVRISSDASNEENAAVTAFLAAQTAAALFHRNPNASSEEEEEGKAKRPQMMMDWAPSNPAAGSNESEQEEGQIIRSSSASSSGQILDQQLANRLLMAGHSSSSARNLAEFLACSTAGSGGKGLPLFSPPAYGGNWNHQQQQQLQMMSMMAMHRSANGMMDDGEVSRGSSHSCGSPHGGVGGGSQSDAKKNANDESFERSNSDSPFAFRNMSKYGPVSSASAGFFPSSGSASAFGPSVSSAPHPFLFPFLSSAPGNSPSANQPMRGAGGSVVGGGIRIFNHEAYCELCNKEFCNKYFLKTHKANKHGIYTDNLPPTTSAGSFPPTSAPSSGPISSTTPTSSSNGAMPFSVSSSFGPPLSLTVGAMTYPMHPPSTELNPLEPSVTYSPITTTCPSKTIYPSASPAITATTSSSTTVTTPTGGMASAASVAGLMDFFPLWSSPTTTSPITTVNTTTLVAPSLMPSTATVKQPQQHIPGGIVNPEAYCDLCQKEFCNKYFLKRHKAKMHGIVPPDGATTTGATSAAPAGSSLPPTTASSGSTPKKSKSHPPKNPSSAVDLIKIPLTLPVNNCVNSTAAFPAAIESASGEHLGPVADPSSVESSSGPFNLSSGGNVSNNETGGSGSSGSSAPSKLDLSNSSRDSLSLLKIPTPSLSTLFSSPPSIMVEHPARHHSKTPCSSSSSSGGAQQLFSPERLRQMGVINTEAFCEICCKEFCNKYFLRTHKFKKHGIGSMPEQPQQQSMSESPSSTGMVRQHFNNNNNNNKNASPGSKQQPESTEQKMPLNLVSTPPATSGQSHPQQQQQADGGMPLSCDLCQRPFQSTYLLHMHRTYFHNQPPPADESTENDMDISTTGADDENASDMHGEEDETRHSDNSGRQVAVKSEPGGVEDQALHQDANNSGGVTISADLQKLQSMIMELNGSSSSAAAAAAVASLAEGKRCWMESGKNLNNPPSHNGEAANHYISGGSGGGGIVKVVEAAPDAAPSPSSVCHLCGNRDFLNPYFLQTHMQNYHGILPSSGDPSAAAMEAAVAAAASQLGLDRLLDFGPSSGAGQSGSGGVKRSGRSSSSASPAATRSYCQICNKELCNKYFMKTHMLKMHGIHLEASGGGAQIGGVQCDICHKELCSKYFLKVHKQNTHGIGFPEHEMMLKDQGVMDLSFHQQQQNVQPPMDPSASSSPPKSSTTECCPFCPKRFKSSKALKSHLSQDHSATSAASSSAASTCCYICNQQFGDVVALQVHLIKSHASHLMDHQTPPPPPPPPQPAAQSTSAAAPAEPQATSNQSCVSSSSSPTSSKTSPPFQCSFCDFATGSLPYLFAHERTHHPSMDPSAGVATSSSAAVANQQKIQCPLCGQQLPLDQFQTHLMTHQLPINFLHTLMPPSSASAATGRTGLEEEEEERSYLHQQGEREQQGQRRRRRRRRYRCSVCSRKFATRQLCLTHILQRHPPSIRSGNTKSGAISSSSPTSPVSCLVQQQRPLTCPRCGYATRQPQLLRLHLRTQQCIPVVARNPDLQQLPPYLAVPTSTASSAQSRAVNNNGLLQVQGQHAHRQDFVLQAFLLTQPDADKSKNRRSKDGQEQQQQQNGHHHDDVKHQHSQHNGRPHQDDDDDEDRKRASSSADNGDGEEEGQNQSCNFIPSLILLPVNRRIANPLSLTFSLTPA